MAHNISFSDEEYQKAAEKWRQQLLLLPMLSCKDSLRFMPFFNRQNNDDLILAIQSAGVSRGRNGFRKDKGGEKLEESEESLLEHRTDGTDAFDTLYIGCEKFPQNALYRYSSNGVA